MGEAKRYAVVDEDGNVVNTVLWNGATDWGGGLKEGYALIQHDQAGIGGRFDGETYIPPEPQEPEPEEEE